MRGGTDRRDVQGTDGKPKRTSAPPETCVKQTTRRGARARFDNVSHPGRHSPVREALRLPGEPVSDEQLIPPEWASFGGVVSPIEPGPRRPDDVVDPTGPRDWRSAKPTAAAPKVGTDRCAPACAAADTDDAGGCRGPLAGTGPLTKWPRCPEDTLAPTGPRRPEHVLAPTGPDPRAGAPSHKKRRAKWTRGPRTSPSSASARSPTRSRRRPAPRRSATWPSSRRRTGGRPERHLERFHRRMAFERGAGRGRPWAERRPGRARSRAFASPSA